MKTRYEYIHFVDECRYDIKTRSFMCHNNNSGEWLGTVKWYGPWRQYCYFPCHADRPVYSTGCLADIQHFIGQLMDERRAA